MGITLASLKITWFASSILISIGVVMLALIYGHGLTSFKRLTAQVHQAQAFNLTQLKTMALLTQGKPLPEILLWMAETNQELFPEASCSILLLDRDGEHLRHGAAPQLPLAYIRAIDGAKIGPEVGSCGTAAYTRKTVVVADIANDPLWRDYKNLALTHGLRACWSVPMISSQGVVLGTFAIYYGEVREPAPEEIKAVEHTAHLTGLVIERHQLLRNLSEIEQSYGLEIAKRKQNEEALRESDEFGRQVIMGLREGITVFDRQLRRLVFNPFMEELTTWRAEDVLGKTLSEMMPTAQAEEITALHLRALQGETVYSGDQFIEGDGKRPSVWVSSKLSPLRNVKGEIVGVIGVLNDISERKRAEQALLDSSALTRRIMAGIENGIAVVDRELRYQVFNPFLERLTGWRAHHVIGKTVSELNLTEEHVADTTERLRRALQGEIVYSGDRFVAATKDHPDLWVCSRASPMHNEQGEIVGAILTVSDIAERKLAESTAEQMAAIVRSSNDAIISKDLERRVRSWNSGAEKLFGYSAAEIVGQSIMRLFPPDRMHEENEIMARVQLGQVTEPFETVRLAKNGNRIPVSLMISPIKNSGGKVIGASKIVRDISASKRMEQELRERERLYRELFQATPHPMWIYDLATLQFLAVNDAAVAQYGYTTEEFLAMTIKDIRRAEDIPALLSAVANQSGSVDKSGIFRHLTKDGRTLLVEISSHQLQFSDRPAKVVLAHDVTGQQAAQEKIIELNATLELRIEERTKALAAKTKELESFCYSVSHDLKAPLRGIDGYSRLLLEDYGQKIDGEGKKFLQNVRTATLQMTDLIDDLLTYSRQDRRSQVMMTINLQHLVTEQVVRSRTDLVKVELEVSVEPVEIVADYDGLMMALRNLIDNAIKFSSKTSSPAIRIRSQVTEGVCILSIKDNGVGFDMRFYSRIFEIFQRLHRAEDYPGTGIGLALVRKVMDRIGGRVWAESQPGQGTTFYLALPLAHQSIVAGIPPLESAEEAS